MGLLLPAVPTAVGHGHYLYMTVRPVSRMKQYTKLWKEVLLLKIEKISDSQIRFTLTDEDLAARQIKLSELAYGTEKARNLFREMMQQAASQVGFEADNIPLMIEAVPMNGGSLVLIVTKVDNPEELDTRFSSFAPSVGTSENSADSLPGSFEQLLHSITGSCGTSEKAPSSQQAAPAQRPSDEMKEAMQKFRDYALCNRLYSFENMDRVIEAASRVSESYSGESVLFGRTGQYLLLLKMKDVAEVSAMQHVLATVSEYASMLPITYARQQYLEEHGNVLIASGALSQLARMSG